MSLIKKMLNKKKELRGDDIAQLFSVITVDREPTIITVGQKFKYVGDIITQAAGVFHVRNTLSRDEIMLNMRNREINVQFPYELTLYGGVTTLVGLGMHQGIHTLKLKTPEILTQEESRGAYRVRSFPETPSATLSSSNADLFKARLLDISMTGAGFHLDPRWTAGEVRIAPRSTMLVDVRINEALRISTSSIVRHIANNKLGVQFEELPRVTKEKLFQFIVNQRREEQRSITAQYRRIRDMGSGGGGGAQPVAATEPEARDSGKPVALVVGGEQDSIDFLSSLLGRKFDVAYAGGNFGEIRSQCERLQPNLCIIELQPDNVTQVSQMKKANSLLPAGCVLMFYGENFHGDFQERFLSGLPKDILVDLTSRKKLFTFKQIEGYYNQKAPSKNL